MALRTLPMALVLVTIGAYCAKWHFGKALEDGDLPECHGQVYVGEKLVGSGFFLEDVSGFKRAYYFITNEHVRRGAAQLCEQTGKPIDIKFKDEWSGASRRLNLGTSAFFQTNRTDIAAIPIYAPFLNRVFARAGYRFVRLNRGLANAEGKRLNRRCAHLICSDDYGLFGITNKAPVMAFHHVAEPTPTREVHEIWTNSVRLTDGYVYSMPDFRNLFSPFPSPPMFRIVGTVIPGDSGSLVFHKNDGVFIATAVITGIPAEIENGEVKQAGPAFAIPADFVVASIPPPTFDTTVRACARFCMTLGIIYAVGFVVLLLLQALVCQTGRGSTNNVQRAIWAEFHKTEKAE